MGAEASDAQANPDEKPLHLVNLAAYWIDKTEVTNAMFARFVSATGYSTEIENRGGGAIWTGTTWSFVSGSSWKQPLGPSSTGQAEYPVVQVTWNDAAAYCGWLGRRLPTEAEWEKAARGEQARLYPWGNNPPESTLANYGDLLGGIAPVGNYPGGASPYGALDMAGNVYEWVQDWYSDSYYSAAPADDPPGPASGSYKVLRGGSWQLDAATLRAYAREVSRPNAGNSNIGFRCASSSAGN
jgi:formylglycine-generating enzyme required for sulfatase activity